MIHLSRYPQPEKLKHTPDIGEHLRVTQLGKGVGLKVMDGSSISTRWLLDEFIALGDKHGMLIRTGVYEFDTQRDLVFEYFPRLAERRTQVALPRREGEELLVTIARLSEILGDLRVLMGVIKDELVELTRARLDEMLRLGGQHRQEDVERTGVDARSQQRHRLTAGVQLVRHEQKANDPNGPVSFAVSAGWSTK